MPPEQDDSTPLPNFPAHFNSRGVWVVPKNANAPTYEDYIGGSRPLKQDGSTPLPNLPAHFNSRGVWVVPDNADIPTHEDYIGGPEPSYQFPLLMPPPSTTGASFPYHAPQAGSSAPPAGYGSTFADQQRRQPENTTFAGSGLPPTGPRQTPTVPVISSYPEFEKARAKAQIAELRKNESVTDEWKAGTSPETMAARFGVDVEAVRMYFRELASNYPDAKTMRRLAQKRKWKQQDQESRGR